MFLIFIHCIYLGKSFHCTPIFLYRYVIPLFHCLLSNFALFSRIGGLSFSLWYNDGKIGCRRKRMSVRCARNSGVRKRIIIGAGRNRGRPGGIRFLGSPIRFRELSRRKWEARNGCAACTQGMPREGTIIPGAITWFSRGRNIRIWVRRPQW